MNAAPFVSRRFVWLLLPLVLALQGCQTLQTSSPTPPESSATTSNHSCALLYELLGDEKNVSKLLIVKRERAELKALIKEVSDYTGKAHQQMEASAKSPPALNLKDNGLPAAEVQTRKAIAKTRAKELLTEHGKDFELLLLLTQNEALTYGAHLASTAAAAETSATRRQQLEQISTRLAELQKKVVAMLLANYNWRATQ